VVVHAREIGPVDQAHPGSKVHHLLQLIEKVHGRLDVVAFEHVLDSLAVHVLCWRHLHPRDDFEGPARWALSAASVPKRTETDLKRIKNTQIICRRYLRVTIKCSSGIVVMYC